MERSRRRKVPEAKPAASAEPAKLAKPKKLFVLDTNVLIHDPMSVFRFKDNDIFIPMATLEELDDNKVGISDVARSCRQASRILNDIVSHPQGGDMGAGYGLQLHNGGGASGRLFIQAKQYKDLLPMDLPNHKGDNGILRVAVGLKSERPSDEPVILVSKDINLRIKASALGIQAEDYWNDEAIEDADLIYTGILDVGDDFWNSVKIEESSRDGAYSCYSLRGPGCKKLLPNMLVRGQGNDEPFYARVTERDGDFAKLRTLIDFEHQKNNVWGICARNLEQSFALNLLLDPEIDLVTILGQAGSGKTLLTLASALKLLFEDKLDDEMVFTRITVPVGEEIGFLPGTEEEKMMPWMGALEDNLDVLTKPKDSERGSWGHQATRDLLHTKIKVKSVTFMRGRTFLNKILVIDEAQNLTPKQMKTLITRAGSGTKVICLGNIAQIDAPYLTESSCGLTYLVERMKGWRHYGHITMSRVERSRLADHAASAL